MMCLARRIVTVLAASAALLTAGRTLADETRDAAIARTADRLAAIENEISRGQTSAASDRLREIVADARREFSSVAEELARADVDLKTLGPPPKDSEPAEAAALASERTARNAALSSLQLQRARLAAAIEKATALLSQVSRRRLETFYRSLAMQDAPLVSPRLWMTAASDWRGVSKALSAGLGRWRDDKIKGGDSALSFALVGAAAILSLLLFGPAFRAAHRSMIEPIQRLEPTRKRRLAVAGAYVLARLAPALVAGIAVIATARATGVLTAGAAPVAQASWIALTGGLIAQGFVAGFKAPSSPSWRLPDVSTRRVRAASLFALAFAGIFGAALVLLALASGSPALIVAVKGVSASLTGALIILLSMRRHWRLDLDHQREDKWTFIRRVARLFGVALIAASIAGYVRIADFAASRVYFGVLLLAVMLSLRATLIEAAAGFVTLSRQNAANGQGEEEVSASRDRRVSHYWIGLSVDALLLVALVPAGLALAGWTLEGVRDLSVRAFAGIRIGGAVISIGDILAGLGAFAGLLAGTRLLQGAVQRGPLAHSRIDRGVQDSLVALMGYAGLLVAVVTGVSILGVDLSSLALIAGALSVGVGLGLQGVVNNFVSGLILLFERPIKVGDWIATQSGQGIVKKISVRSTEIETFEKSSIIVPNSELVSSAVTNYTHRNSLGRVTVAVNVAYAAEPRRVHDILLDCARRNPLFLIDPGPFVIWKSFGAAALEFEVSGFLADVGKGPQARNELRFAIFDAFQKEGVPFPRQDVHLHYPDNAVAAA